MENLPAVERNQELTKIRPGSPFLSDSQLNLSQDLEHLIALPSAVSGW